MTKRDGDWKHLKPAILGAVMEHFTQRPCPAGRRRRRDRRNLHPTKTVRSSQQIKELIETRVRPAVAQDGGDIIFKGFDGVQRHRLAASARVVRRLPVLDHDLEERHREHAAPLCARSDRGRSSVSMSNTEPYLARSRSRDYRRRAGHHLPQRPHHAPMAGQAGVSHAHADGDL